MLPLESFRSTFSYHPWHFWQLSSAARFPIDPDCKDLIYQYAWQGVDSTGRDDIARAIGTAEDRLREWLGYSVAPHFVEKTLIMPRWYDDKLNRLGYVDATGRWLGLQLPEGKIQCVGIERRTLIETATVAAPGHLVYSDSDGDGLNDTFTLTIATTVTDPAQLEVMFASGDRFTGEPIGEKWVIAPLFVTIAGGTATIKGKAWQAVRPALYEPGSAIDPATASNFAQSMDVYRHYCDPTGTTQDTAQAVLIWETKPWPYFVTCLGCGVPNIVGNTTDPAAVGYALARVTLRDAERGIVALGEAVYDAVNAVWASVTMSNYRPPDRVIIRYRAGDDFDANGLMQTRWRDVVSKFAAAELGKRVCACEAANRMIYNQQIDRAFGGDARVEKFSMTTGDDGSPFGFREGQLNAWRIVRNLRQLGAVIA